MTIGNTPTVKDAANNTVIIPAVAQANAVSKQNSGFGFSSVMNRYERSGADTDRNVNGNISSGAKTSKSKDAIKLNQKREVKDTDVQAIASDIKEVVKDALDISDNTLENAMSELGITAADLLNPQNVAALLAQIQEADPETILTDETLSGQLTDILQGISEIINDFSQESQIPVDQILEAVNTYFAENGPVTERENPVAEEVLQTPEQSAEASDDIQESVVTIDSETGKEVHITVEQNVVTSEEVTVDDLSDNMEDGTGTSGEEQAEPDESFASQVLFNLSEAVEQTSQAYGEISSGYPADGADIIRQMIDAVKVRVTEEIQSMEIQLTPENLGKISLTVAAKDGMITASITAQNEAVKSAIENQIIMLKESLESQGIKVEQVEVTVASHEFDANFMNNGKNETGDQTKSNARRRFKGLDELPEEERVDVREQNPEPADGNSINLTA